MTDPLSDRAARSRTALQARFPDLCEAMDRLGPASSRLIGTLEAGDLNLDLGHTTLYRDGAVAFTEAQLSHWRQRPGRFYMEPPARRDTPLQQQDHVAIALYAAYTGREAAIVPAESWQDPGGYLLVYGIGLGLHLPALFAEAPVRHFVLIEEHLEFFRHSLGLVDWTEILERLEANGQTLNLIIGTDPHVVGARVHWLMRGRGFGLIDGSFLYRHYRSTMLDLAHQDFVKNLPLLPISIGYWEDELVMLEHGTVNLTRHEFDLMEIGPRLAKDIPAFIVGSGPSLDLCLEDLRRLAGQAVIFSSGTALQPLLKNGIRPDFQCELENGLLPFELLDALARTQSFEGVTLLAATTIHPAIAPLFGERVLYFRDSVCSTPLWCPGGLGIHGTAPTCTNLALRAALVMGFKEIYLFGVDLGTRDQAAHHARETIYFDDEQMRRDTESDPLKVMNIPLPGNFGGTAYTNQILHWARMMMAQSIENFSFSRIFNCSDGASVPGTLPKLARTIRLPPAPGRKAATLARLKRELRRVAAGELAPASDLVALRRAVAEHFAALRTLVATSRRDGLGFVPFYECVQNTLTPHRPDRFQQVLRAIDIGTIMMFFQIGFFFHRRLPATDQPALMRLFLDLLDDRFAEMAVLTDRKFDRIEEWRPQPAAAAT